MDGTPGANEQIVVAIVGMGMRGNQLVKNIPAGGRIAAICDADAGKTAAAMEKFTATWNVYDDYRKLLERKDLTGVIICPCDHHHVHASILACQSGLDVYVEKPLTAYLAEGRTLVKVARKYQRVVQTGTQQRTMEMDRFACEFVRDGGIGKLKLVETVNYSSSKLYVPADFPEEPIRAGMNWDLWQGPAHAHPFNHLLCAHYTDKTGGFWGSCRDFSAGQTGGMGAHAYDMIQYALGADLSGPVEFWLVGPPKDRTARVDFRYANGVEVHLVFKEGPNHTGPQQGAVFTGEKCKIEINRNKFNSEPMGFVKNGPDAKLAKKWEGEGYLAEGHVQNWFDCIKSRGKPNADVETGHRTISIGHIVNIVRQIGAPGETLKWDTTAERFTNSEAGNQLLDRPRRKGWELPDV